MQLRPWRLAAAALGLASLLATRASAQDTPEAVARAYFAALQAQHWSEAAALTDPAEVQRFRRQRIEMARAARRPASLTVEELRRMDPQMPECVARYQVEQAQRYASRVEERMRGLLPGAETPGELEALPPGELLARSLRAADPRVQAEEAMRMEAEVRPALRDSLARVTPDSLSRLLPSAQRTVVGSVRQGDTLAYVVFRWVYGPEKEPWHTRMQVLPTVRRGGVWRVATVGGEGDTDFFFAVGVGEPAEEKAAKPR